MLELEDRQQIKERSSSLHGVLPVTVQNRCPTWLVIREGRGGAVGPEEGLHPQAGLEYSRGLQGKWPWTGYLHDSVGVQDLKTTHLTPCLVSSSTCADTANPFFPGMT